MSELNDFDNLRVLRTDLIALSESRLDSLDRLIAAFDAQVGELRGLLDKKARDEQSRQSLGSGKVKIGDEEWAVNEEFQQGTLQLADEVDLDELEAAKLFFEAQGDAGSLGETVLEAAIIRFHQRRINILDCLRLTLELSLDVDQDAAIRGSFQTAVVGILQPPEGPRDASGHASKFVVKCLTSMGAIRTWIQKLADKLNSASILGQGHQPEFFAMVEFQRTSLIRQHELLGMILFCLVKGGHSLISDFEHVIDIVKKVDKYDSLLIHHFPAIAANISRFGAPEGGGTMDTARALHAKFLVQDESNPWTLVYVGAGFKAWWLAEYSGWYSENYTGTAMNGVNLNEEAKQRSKQFTEVLNQGAFDFLLSLSADVKTGDWSDPARHGLRQWLQRKAPALLPDTINFSNFFQGVLMEQLESFIEGFITNLPDVLRKLRIDEDEQRQLSQVHEHDLDLERFLVIISYVFENRPKAALEGFWDVRDGALLGFMHWASRRASTPLVSAFCEMLQALSDDEDCATYAHQFLLDDGPLSSGKMRRTHSLTWRTIITELTYFCEKIRNRPAVSQSHTYRNEKLGAEAAEAEPESVMMLECYLRLITKLCSESGDARLFLLEHPTFHLVEMLFQLASSAILPRLRACAFTTLASLASNKTRPVGDFLWSSLDVWICGGYSPSSTGSKSAPLQVSSTDIQRIFLEIGSGFEQPYAFIEFLHALIMPYEEEAGLNDGLPFPENLGSTIRTSGIDPYIDFVVGQIFGGRLADSIDSSQLRLLQLTCLNFISTCLQTFNEDLVVLANRSNVSVDTAINTSDLSTYVRLHPFSRVMEWTFSENVMTALLTSMHQNAADVGQAVPGSPIIECLLRGIEVATMILDLQATYFDIIRPALKQNSMSRRKPVSDAAFSCFEDGVLNHLSIVSDLGLYCGLGHSNLTISSLKLLEKLSGSSKFATSTAGLGRRMERNKVIAVLEVNNDDETIATRLSSEIREPWEVSRGPDSESYKIKLNILDFLTSCIRASPARPCIAHLLLGFHCGTDNIYIDSKGLFAEGRSLFHTILDDLVLDLELYDEQYSTMPSWRITLSYKALDLLKLLWKSPLSADLTMNELRAYGVLPRILMSEPVMQPHITWDDLGSTDPMLLSSTAASCLSNFLSRRATVLQYMAAELRQISQSQSSSSVAQTIETLLGTTTVLGEQKVACPTIFDLFDFMELDLDLDLLPPEAAWLKDLDFGECVESDDAFGPIFNLRKVEELLLLRRAEFQKTGRLTVQQDEEQFTMQAQELLTFIVMDNQLKQLRASKLQTLRSWVHLMLIMIKTGGFTGSMKTAFVLQALQTILPRLENSMDEAAPALELARLANGLLFSLEFSSDELSDGDMGNLTSDRLFQLFQASLRAICSPGSDPELKETFYEICYRYLTGMADATSISRRHSIQNIKGAGERFMDLVCDDAYAGEPMCRISALLLLGALVQLGNAEKSKYIIDSLSRLNFISIIVGSFQSFIADLSDTSRDEVTVQLAYCNARLALLAHLCQTRHGATAVINAGLFRAVKVSNLFSKDPDLGVDIDDPDAVNKYYAILAAVMRVICIAVISRGSQNEQTLDQGRRFLSDNRLSILAVLKKSAGLGTTEAGQSVVDLADSFMLLISTTGFLDFDEQTSIKPHSALSFT